MSIATLINPKGLECEPLAVSEAEAARLLGVSPRTLFNWRAAGSGPRPVKAGGRVLYSVDELRRWLAASAKPVTSMAASPVSPAEQASSTQQAVQPGQGGAA